MEFPIKIWKDRVSENPNRRKLIAVSADEETGETVVDVQRDEGLVRELGNQFSALEMNDLESRIKSGFDSTAQDMQTQDKNMKIYVDKQDESLDEKITKLTNAVPILQKNFTLTVAGWAAYTESGRTLYRQQVTGVSVKATDRFDCTCSAYYESQLYASLIPQNNNGTLYVTTSIKPILALAIQVFLTPTRSS